MESKIGLEIHAYLSTNEKLFCKCKAERHLAKSNIKANTNICPICTAQPGCKPMLPNEQAINKILQIALLLNCKINPELIWQRKHYDWPDLPKGYQITMSGAYSIPLGENGKFSNIKIREIHLEEDPASWNPETGCIDYNRSGLPLAEIVTEPDFESAEQVEVWLKLFLLTLSYIKAVDKNAGIKADVNVSIKKNNFERVEIKNLSSIENIKAAINFEIKRQEKEPAVRETRRFDEAKGITIRMRSKEQQEDYRFIPDPDLPVVKITKDEIEKTRQSLPETPQQKLDKLIKKHKIDKKQAGILTSNLELVEFFEKIAAKIPAREALHWITVELLRVLNYSKRTLEEVEIRAEHFIELLEAVKLGKITELKAKQILNRFIPKSFSIKASIKSEGKITDKKELKKIAEKVIKANNKSVSDYKSGKKEAFNFLMGEIMKASERRADFKIAAEILKEMLK